MSYGATNVTVCIPYFRSASYIRRSVESILQQTYRDITLVVVNDGDGLPPWSQLSNITDNRLVRFSLSRNQGRYFATEVVARATRSRYLLIQDSDDVSMPNRLQRLLGIAACEHSDFVSSAIAEYLQSHSLRFSHFHRFRACNSSANGHLAYDLYHHGLWKTSFLSSIGGYYGGFRIGYDSFLTSLALLLGRVSYIDEPVYLRISHPGSLTLNRYTGYGSQRRKAVARILTAMYREIAMWRNALLKKQISMMCFVQHLHQVVKHYVPPQESRALYQEANRLRQLLK